VVRGVRYYGVRVEQQKQTNNREREREREREHKQTGRTETYYIPAAAVVDIAIEGCGVGI
jgi:hypothetical protein